MRANGFEHFRVHQDRLYVSICRNCLRFVAAAPDPTRLGSAEEHHECTCPPKKPAASVLFHEPVAIAKEYC